MNRFTGLIAVNSLLVLLNLGIGGYSGYILYEEHKENESWKTCDSILIYSTICAIVALLYGLYRVTETVYTVRARRVLRNRLNEPTRYCGGANILILFCLYLVYIGFHTVLCVKLRNMDSDCIHYFKREINGVGNVWGVFIAQISNFLVFVITGFYLMKQSLCPARNIYDSLH